MKQKTRKTLRALLCIILTLVMMMPNVVMPNGLMPQTVAKADILDENLALGKTVTVSGIEGGYLSDGTLKYPQFVETNLVDGSASTRWSSGMTLTATNLEDNPDQNEWACIDLGQEYNIGRVVMKWQNANSRDYDVQISSDGETWSVLHNYVDPDNTGVEYTETLNIENGVTGRYIRIYARLGTTIAQHNDMKCPSISLYEVEVYEYSATPSMSTILDSVLAKQPTANDDYTQLILPEVDYEGYAVKLYSTSNPAVVTVDGKITQPLEDMKVNLFYELTAPDGTTLKGDDPQQVVIAGLYTEEESINEKPDIVPEIREWKGNEGYFTYTGNIVLAEESLRATAEQIAMYFEEMIGRTSTITAGTPAVGDIYLALDAESVLGDEGYAMDIDDILTVTAKTEKGILYGGTSISQILTQAEDHMSVPKGLVRDYPQYEVRAVMLDVARLYIPFEHLVEMTKYAGYFKLSEFRNHINETGGEQSSSFRIESKVYPQLNEGITYYTQEEYKAYQKEAKKFGVDVVTEIDTPAHAGAFGKIDPALMMDGYHLDLRTDEAYARTVSVMKEVFDEFLDGDDPVFQSTKFHIGTDEYDKSYSEYVRKYMDEMINYINSKGLECRFWASLGTNGFAGTTPVSTDAVAHMWSHSWASFDEMKEAGYKFINNADGILYIVPWAGYNNYLNIKNLYNTWEYSNLNRGYYLAAGHPQLLGAEAALWNDIKVGASEFDIFDRFRDQIMIMAEKGWYGEDDDETGDDFMARVEAVGKKTPQANPARYVESAAPLVAAYDFENVVDGIVADVSGNSYDGTLNGAYIKDGALRLNGEGYLSLPFESIGYPYTAQFEITIDKVTPENAVIFDGNDGTLFYNYDGTGCIGFERKGYSYIFDYQMPAGIKTTVTLTCDAEATKLYINGLYVGAGEYYKVKGATKQASSTFVLPVEQIGAGIYGKIDNLQLYNYTMGDAEINGIGSIDSTSGKNLALGKAVTVSGVEGGYLDDGTLKYPQFDPIHATDGDTSTRISLTRADDDWVTVDLGKTYLIESVYLRFGELPNAYAIEVSEDGESWTRVEERTGLAGGTKSDENIVLEGIVKARYVKYQQIEQFVYAGNGSKYSGNFSEFEVYGYELDAFDNVIAEANAAIETVGITEDNQAFVADIQANIAKLEAMMSTGPIEEMNLLKMMIQKQTQMLLDGNVPTEVVDKSELETLLATEVNLSHFSTEGQKQYEQAVQFGKNVLYNVEAEADLVAYACDLLRTAIDNPVSGVYVVITTNKQIYQDYVLNRLIDNDTTSLTWLQANQVAGDYILFSFRDIQTLSNIKIYSTNAGSDIIHNGKVELSMDGTNWTQVAEIGENALEDITFDEMEARYVKISVTEGASYWWKITEVVFNDTAIQDKSLLEKELAVEVDASLYTEDSYAAYVQVKADAQVVYDDADSNQIAIDNATAALIEVRKDLVAFINTSELQALIDSKEDASLYTEESYAGYEAAYEAGKALLENADATQSEVDIAVWKIQEAITLLVVDDTPTVLKIITQPTDVLAKVGENATVIVEAQGDGLTYTWYYKKAGGHKFYKSVIGVDDTYSVEMYPYRNGYQVYCEISDKYGNTVQTNTVTLSMNTGSIVIIKQPENSSAAIGDTVTVTVEAEGDDLSYVWYYKKANGGKFYQSGNGFANENTYTTTMYSYRDGYQLYCVITDANGYYIQTNTVTLSMLSE